jgi:hypothetical protein
MAAIFTWNVAYKTRKESEILWHVSATRSYRMVHIHTICAIQSAFLHRRNGMYTEHT